MKYFKTISIRRTATEWTMLDKIVKEAGKDDLGQLLRIKISEFLLEYENCPECKTKAKGERTEKRPSIYKHQINKLKKIGNQMGLAPSKVVDRLIIESLLSGK